MEVFDGNTLLAVTRPTFDDALASAVDRSSIVFMIAKKQAASEGAAWLELLAS